ncbi:MAG: SNF2 helicase associated domain-containing protein, partial [Cyanobacteria bacterium]|nr:SNF2 helicase associated domain-containing protein [Cyanobacteriota bacterium]
KDAYQIDLKFDEEGPHATCDCPLEEEWCKHAIAVALVSVRDHLWESFWGLDIPDETCSPDDSDSATLGNFRFVLDTKRKPKHISINIIDRRASVPVIELEPVLRAALAIQQATQAQFTELEKREFSIFQMILKQGMSRSMDGWYHLPLSDVEGLFKILATLENVSNPAGLRIIFEPTPLKLVMAVNVSMAGNVLISLHWVQVATPEAPQDIFPLEEITLIGRDIPWGFRNNHFFSLANTVSALPHYLTKSSFTDVRDADGGKFMYEELPHLRKKVEVDEADIIEQLRLEKRPPVKQLTMEMVDEATNRIRVSLDFLYDGIEVSYSRTAPDTPYVMVIKKETETIYWVKRDSKAEKEAYNTLVAGKLSPMQTNFLSAEGDDAIDVYNVLLPALGDDWQFKGKEELEILKVAEHPLVIQSAIDFCESVDQFMMTISCGVGDIRIELDEVQQHLMQGTKYFFLPGAGYVEVPLASILQFGKTLQGFDAYETERDHYQVMTFKAGLIAELLDQGVVLKMSPKFETFWNRISTFGT